MTFSVTGLCLSALVGLATVGAGTRPLPSRLGPAAFAGVYAFGKLPADAGGQLTIYPESDSTILFYLEVNRGKPNYNNGALLGRAVVHGRTAVCAFNAGYSVSVGCRLRLIRQASAVLVQTTAGQDACGFGYGVEADHTYVQRSTAVPLSFRDGTGRKVVFKGLNPQQYNAGGQ